MSPRELGELLAAFNEVTSRLQATHEQLNAEVIRLRTELVEANHQLERSRRLAALGEMAAGIAHEVRNPLGSIRLYAKMLDEDLVDRPAQRETVRKIAGAARGLDQIVGDMLSFAREFRVRVDACDASDLFDQALAACCHDGVPAWSRTRIVRADRERAGASVEADPGLVLQALVNIVRNAFEAIEEAGAATAAPTLTLDVLSRQVSVNDGPARVMTALVVSDSGPGVSDETIRRMFNPFYTTRATGTGLGLAIVHRIMDAHEGRVIVRNNTGAGATVELLFPVRAAAEPAEVVVQAGAVSASVPDRGA
jgi:signal transduction histidine kinase